MTETKSSPPSLASVPLNDGKEFFALFEQFIVNKLLEFSQSKGLVITPDHVRAMLHAPIYGPEEFLCMETKHSKDGAMRGCDNKRQVGSNYCAYHNNKRRKASVVAGVVNAVDSFIPVFTTSGLNFMPLQFTALSHTISGVPSTGLPKPLGSPGSSPMSPPPSIVYASSPSSGGGMMQYSSPSPSNGGMMQYSSPSPSSSGMTYYSPSPTSNGMHQYAPSPTSNGITHYTSSSPSPTSSGMTYYTSPSPSSQYQQQAPQQYQQRTQ